MRQSPTPSPVLVIVDVQRGFVKQYTSEIPTLIADFLREHSHRFSTIAATQFYNPENSSYERLIGWKRLREPYEIELAPEILPWIDEVIPKQTYMAIPEILAIADRVGTREIFFCGIDTDVCVLQNAAGVFDAGYIPKVIYDLSATGGGVDAHRAAYPLLGRTIGRAQVVKCDDFPV